MLNMPKMMKPKVVELKDHIWSQIWNYEDLSYLITSLQASHARVFKSMDVVVHTHVIPSIGKLIEVKTKAPLRLKLDSYIDKLVRIATNLDLVISADTMHKYVFGLAALKKMMHMLSNDLERGARALYPDSMKERVHFEKDVTLEYTYTIENY